MFNKLKQQELDSLSPENLQQEKKQRSLNRIFGLLLIIGILLFAMLVYEIVLLII